MMDAVIWIILLVLGFILLLVELFVIPGTSVVGIMGFSALSYGVIRIFMDYGMIAGLIALTAVLTLTAGLIFWVWKTKSWKKIMLNDKLEGKVNTINPQKVKVGDEGRTVSRLAPMGHASFAEEIVEVQSVDGFIDPKIMVKISKIEGNKIFVTHQQ